MKLTVVGCSPSWPTPGGVQSGYLIEEVGASLLLECGPGVVSALRVGRLWPELDAIVLTHLHLDHWGNLVSWVWGSAALESLGYEITRPALWLPPGGEERLEQFAQLLDAPGMFTGAFAVREYAPEVPFTVGNCAITPFEVFHFSRTAYAMRLEADGRTLAYSADSRPCDGLVQAARDVDLFICEATLPDATFDGSPRGHLTLADAQSIFERSGAAELLITHRPAELDLPADVGRAYDGLVRSV